MRKITDNMNARHRLIRVDAITRVGAGTQPHCKFVIEFQNEIFINKLLGRLDRSRSIRRDNCSRPCRIGIYLVIVAFGADTQFSDQKKNVR